MLPEFIANFVLGVIKTIVLFYDVLTFPVYYVIQKPWAVKSQSERVRARQVNPADPRSPWVREGQSPTHYIQTCKTVDELFRKSVEVWRGRRCCATRQIIGEEDEKQPDGKVFKKLILTDYKWISFLDMDRRIDHVGRALLATGIKPRDRVLMFAETRLEWMISAQAILRIGCTVCTLYSTLGDEGIIHGINETEVTHIITSHDLLPKLKRLQSKLPKVTHIIYMEGFRKPNTEGFDMDTKLIPFSELEEIGKITPEDIMGQKPTQEDIAVILYTSGSTGVPKGVMISHRNFVATVCSFLGVCGSLLDDADKQSFIAYLPLAHILEFAAECFFYAGGVKIGYSTPTTLTDNSTAIKSGQKGDASLFCPTIMAAVPLVLDRIRKGITEKVGSRGPFAKGLFDFAIEYKKFWIRKYYRTPIVNALICKKIKANVGGKVQFLLCGGAPLSPDTQEFIRACLDVHVFQGYGATETSASTTIQDLDDPSVGRVGAPLHGVQLKLRDWDEGGYHVTDKPNPRGEVLCGGTAVALGYFKLDEQTREAFFEEDGVRWFATGDIGEMCPDGVLKIIDRKKDLVKLQFGEYVSLGKVEAELKSCPYVDNICVYGNGYHNYIVALIVPSENGLNTLAQQLKKEKLSREDMCDDETITVAVCEALQAHGKKAGLHRSEIPMRCKLVKEEWTPDSGFVTAAMKLRRKNIQDHYMSDINEMYNGSGMDTKPPNETNGGAMKA